MRRFVQVVTSPVDFWRNPRATMRDWSTRRMWPGRSDLSAMEPAALNRYLASIGTDARVDEAADGRRDHA